jgi:hypothetical protein
MSLISYCRSATYGLTPNEFLGTHNAFPKLRGTCHGGNTIRGWNIRCSTTVPGKIEPSMHFGNRLMDAQPNSGYLATGRSSDAFDRTVAVRSRRGTRRRSRAPRSFGKRCRARKPERRKNKSTGPLSLRAGQRSFDCRHRPWKAIRLQRRLQPDIGAFSISTRPKCRSTWPRKMSLWRMRILRARGIASSLG